MPDFSADLSVSSLDQLLSNLKAYKKKVDEAPEKITARLAEIGEQAINANIAGITDLDGNAPGTVSVDIDGAHAMVSQVGEQIAYLEFGTGTQGANSPHPLAGDAGWQYNSGEHIRPTKNGKMMWRYYDNLKDHWRITDGIPAQRQVLEAALLMRDSIPTVAGEVLK